MANRTLKGLIVEIGGDTSGLQKALNQVNSTSSSLSKELKGINSLLKLDPKNVELLNQKQTVLNQSIENTRNKLDQLKKVKDETDKKIAEGAKISEENYRNLQREIVNTENKLNNLTDELKQFNVQNSNWTKAGKKIEEYGNEITAVGKKIDDIGNKASAISAGVVAGGTALANSAMNVEDAVAKYISSTNTAEIETEKYKKVLEDINKNNYGDGYEDIADSMIQVKVQLKDLNEQDLQNITEQAIALRDLFGYDVSESIRAVKAMMDNLNVSADEAFNLIAEGKKQGLDFSNELLDNINEYSVQFGKLGLSAEDMFNIFKVGADNGAFNLDKIGDAVKEFSIRVIDGSNTTIDGFKRIGLNADKMAKKFAKGGEEAKEAFIEVVTRLGKMDDKVSQNIAGVDLFGTMWEDLGPTVITSFAKMDNGISKSSDSMQKSIDQLYNTTKKKAETQLKRLKSLGADFGEEMLPILEDLIDMAEGFIDKLEGMSDAEKENIAKLGLFVAALGPAIKTAGTAQQVIGGVTKGIGTFSKAIGVATNKTTSSEKSVNNLAKAFGAITSPVGLASIGIGLAVTAIIASVNNAEKETKEAFSNMGNSATEFITGINSAESHLSAFNSTLFVSAEEQQKLQEEMQEIQNGITQICKTASDERRGYTQKEITQLDDYFAKLRDLKNREIEIQSQIANAITQQAATNAESFQGSLEEYKIQSQEWIKTATEQNDATIKLIQEGTTQQIALLNQRYSTEESRRTEEYQKEYQDIINQQNEKIEAANNEVAKVTSIYANSYLERAKQNDGFYISMQEYLKKLESEQERHNKRTEELSNTEQTIWNDVNGAIRQEEYEHKETMKKISDEMYRNMSEEQEKELGIWLAQVAQTELYGGKIDDETKRIVDSILDSYNGMPKGTQEAMKNAMEPMLTEMEKKEPSLFVKASDIADGILSRLRKSFDIHSPSKKTREIFKNVMASPEQEMEKGRKILNEKAKAIATDVLKKFNGMNFNSNFKGINSKVIEKSKTIFTTPQIVFNVQELDEAKLQQCFNYINKKFGSAY